MEIARPMVNGKSDAVSTVTVTTSPFQKCFGTPGTRRARHVQMLKLFGLTLMPGLMLIVQNGIYLQNSKELVSEQNIIKENVLFSFEISKVIHRSQIERGTSALYLASGGSYLVRDRLLQAYTETDKALAGLSRWVSRSDPPHFVSRNAFHARIKDFRAHFDIDNRTLEDTISFYTSDNERLISYVASVNQQGGGVDLWASLVAYHMLVKSKDYTGIERALGGTFFARGSFPPEDLAWYLRMKFLGISYLDQASAYSKLVQELHQTLYLDNPLSDKLAVVRETISSNYGGEENVAAGALWFDNMTEFIDILHTIENELAIKIVKNLEDEIQELDDGVLVSALQMTSVLILVPFVVLLVVKATRQIQAFAEGLQLKTVELEQERKRTEQLLFQILPKSVATKLLRKEDVIPEEYTSVTVLFSDIVGFTNISGRGTPIQVIDLLNRLYLLFDITIEKFDAYKVETVGDAYMVASGLPQRNGDQHAVEIAEIALQMMENLEKIEISHIKGEKLKLRIGFNTGPVVAGVIGTKMPRYCVFGDTVNIASRMESTGKPCRIQITESARHKLTLFGGFVIKERGEVFVKGKGMMTTFWLLGKQNAAAPHMLDVSPVSSCHSINEHITSFT